MNVDRVKASQLGLTQRDVTSSMLISLSGSSTVAPNFWLNWTNGVNYNVGVQTPQYRVDSLDALLRTPISVATSAENGVTAENMSGASGGSNSFVAASPNGSSQAYGNPGAMSRQHPAALQSGNGSKGLHAGDREPLQRSARCSTCTRMSTGAIWAAWAPMCEKIMREEEPHLPRGTSFALRGQVATMQSSFFRLGARNDFRRGSGLSADDRQLSVLARSLHHSDCPARRHGRHSLDAVRHRHHSERAVADGRDHVYRRRHRQQHSDGDLRQRRTRGWRSTRRAPCYPPVMPACVPC